MFKELYKYILQGAGLLNAAFPSISPHQQWNRGVICLYSIRNGIFLCFVFKQPESEAKGNKTLNIIIKQVIFNYLAIKIKKSLRY